MFKKSVLGLAVLTSLSSFTVHSKSESINLQVERLCLKYNETCKIQSSSKKQLINDVYEYAFDLQVGPQAEDKITIHRVIKEANGKPIKAEKGVFLVHGDVFGFDQIFLAGLTSEEGVDTQSYAYFLANKNIDVWGLDRRFIGVPATTTNFNFMQNWNIETEIQDVKLSLTLARVIRTLTGSGNGKMILNGWSSGGFVTYAYANAEAQVPAPARHVKAMIPMDIVFKFNPANTTEIQKSCNRQTAIEGQYAAGTYFLDGGNAPKLIGTLADNAPLDPSPLVPGFNNYQTALFLGGFIYLLDPGFDIVPFFHQTAAVTDSMGIPTGLRFSDEQFFIDFIQTGAPFMNIGYRMDMEATWCNQTDVAYDDNLAAITIPTLYVGGAGGLGEYGEYTQTLLGSADKSNLLLQYNAPGDRLTDYGHSDLFLADDAENAVWTPVYNWIQSH